MAVKADVIDSKFIPAIKDEAKALRDALVNPIGTKPLKKLAAESNRIAIVVNDITRATPYKKILPSLFEELSGIDDSRIIFFVATGTHRANTSNELKAMLGSEVIRRFNIIQNDANDVESHSFAGCTSSGNKVYIHSEYLKCDLKILTGFIEPHFFAGFSGGPKACVPGLAGLETIMNNHCYEKLSEKNAVWAVTKSNPLWQELNQAALLAGRPFLINVALNSNKEIVAIFAGDIELAHETGCKYVKQHAMVEVKQPYDIVICSNSGDPLDLNLYQSVKGISAASQILKKNGSIILAASCWDGIPQNSGFEKILKENKTPKQLIDKIKNGSLKIQDSWQAYILCKICENVEVYFYSDNLSDEQIINSFLKPCRNIELTVQYLLKRYGKNTRIGILPQGPLTVPHIG